LQVKFSAHCTVGTCSSYQFEILKTALERYQKPLLKILGRKFDFYVFYKPKNGHIYFVKITAESSGSNRKIMFFVSSSTLPMLAKLEVKGQGHFYAVEFFEK
jgi:hypothetical protein